MSVRKRKRRTSPGSSDPGGIPPADKLDLVVVESASNPTVAQLIVGILKEAGIAAWIPGIHLQDEWAISQTRMGLLSVDVLVAPEDVDDARRVLARAQKVTRARGPDVPEARVPSRETLEPGEEPEGQPDAQVPHRPDGELWLETSVVLAITLLPMLYWTIADLVWRSPTPSSLQDALTSIVGHGGLGLGALVLYLIRQSGEPWSRFGLTRPGGLDAGLFIFFLFLDIVVVGNLSYLIRAGLFGSSGTTPAPLFERMDLLGYMLVIAGTGISAFSQEVLMRGYLIPRFERLLRSTWKSLLLTTLLFAAYHLHRGIPDLIHPVLLGLLYGGAFCLTRRLWPIALVHAAHNLIAVLPNIYLTM